MAWGFLQYSLKTVGLLTRSSPCSFSIPKNKHEVYTTTQTWSWYLTATKITFKVYPVYIKPHSKFEINPFNGSPDTYDQIWADIKGDTNITVLKAGIILQLNEE